MLPERNDDHVVEARALLIEQFRKKPVIQAFLDAYIRPLQDVEDALWDVIDSRVLPDAVDAQLDSLGDLVKERRRGRTDAEYRVGIGIKIKVLRSKGRIRDIIEISQLANAPGTPNIENHRHLNFQVDVVEQIGERYLADYLSSARAAGSYGNLIASDLEYAELLAFDDENDPDGDLETFGDAQSETGLLAASVYALPADWTSVTLSGDDL